MKDKEFIVESAYLRRKDDSTKDAQVSPLKHTKSVATQ